MIVMRERLMKEISSETPDENESKPEYMTQVQNEIAPDFLNAEEILNEVPLWPLFINIFSACFCMGCSALYHLFYVRNEKY